MFNITSETSAEKIMTFILNKNVESSTTYEFWNCVELIEQFRDFNYQLGYDNGQLDMMTENNPTY